MTTQRHFCFALVPFTLALLAPQTTHAKVSAPPSSSSTCRVTLSNGTTLSALDFANAHSLPHDPTGSLDCNQTTVCRNVTIQDCAQVVCSAPDACSFSNLTNVALVECQERRACQNSTISNSLLTHCHAFDQACHKTRMIRIPNLGQVTCDSAPAGSSSKTQKTTTTTGLPLPHVLGFTTACDETTVIQKAPSVSGKGITLLCKGPASCTGSLVNKTSPMTVNVGEGYVHCEATVIDERVLGRHNQTAVAACSNLDMTAEGVCCEGGALACGTSCSVHLTNHTVANPISCQVHPSSHLSLDTWVDFGHCPIGTHSTSGASFPKIFGVSMTAMVTTAVLFVSIVVL